MPRRASRARTPAARNSSAACRRAAKAARASPWRIRPGTPSWSGWRSPSRPGRPSDSCLSGPDLTAGGRSLLDTRGYIARSGGEYPDYALFLDGRKITDFPTDHVMEAFFIANGTYAVFVHWESAGVTVYNLASGASRVLLEDVLVVYSSLTWRDGRFAGRQMNPPDGEDTPFLRQVELP